ncbi:hypothetical protein ACO2Q9_18775 [Variovorax sp. VNK109]|uniref:hypothetical protein n=1 Tax=Variovorax sp. VNK109 TaxID=3400919 RepID=UPI003BFAB5C2
MTIVTSGAAFMMRLPLRSFGTQGHFLPVAPHNAIGKLFVQALHAPIEVFDGFR